MIGLAKIFDGANARNQEASETKDLSKHKIYSRLNEQYLLPPEDSKGVCRSWLLQVWYGNVYRVGLRDFKTFEVGVTSTHMKRNGLTNLMHLMLRINGLLKGRGEKVLGFHEFTVPDEKWLCKIARYVDQSNVLEFFQLPVNPITHLSPDMPPSEQIHYCRMFAYDHLLVHPGHMKNQLVYNAVIQISEWHRKNMAKRIEAEECDLKLKQVTREQKNAEMSLKDHVLKAATALYCIEKPAFRPDKLINGGQDLEQEDRRRLQELAEM